MGRNPFTNWMWPTGCQLAAATPPLYKWVLLQDLLCMQKAVRFHPGSCGPNGSREQVRRQASPWSLTVSCLCQLLRVWLKEFLR